MRRRWVLLIVAGSCLASGSAAAEPKSSPVCLYESKAFSEGAYVCVEKSLMLTCTADGPHMSWKVADKDISERCTAPTVRHAAPERRVHPHRHHYAIRRSPAEFNGPKCFAFNGRQYCE